MNAKNILRAVSVLAVMVAGSCAAPDEGRVLTEDGATNHPITVEPTYRSLRLPNSDALSNKDAASFSAFVDDYLERGNGAISVSVPPGPGSERIVTTFAERLVDMGVPRSHILVGVQDQAAADGRLEIGYISYAAHTIPCGDWSVNVADTANNLPMPNFGCSVQQNIAAQVADPRDIVEPRGMGPADATRRMQVINNYEKAQTTAAQKTQAQSGNVADVTSQ